MRNRVGIAVTTLVLAACGGEELPPPDMALACQTMECECTEVTGTLFSKAKTESVGWRLNGDAYCRAGYALRKKKEK